MINSYDVALLVKPRLFSFEVCGIRNIWVMYSSAVAVVACLGFDIFCYSVFPLIGVGHRGSRVKVMLAHGLVDSAESFYHFAHGTWGNHPFM